MLPVGEYDRGIEFFDKAIALDHNLVSAYRSRGFSKVLGRHNSQEAFDDFAKAIEIDPECGHTYEFNVEVVMLG